MTRKELPKYVYRDRGYVRFIRRARGQSVMMKEEPGTPEFWDEYNRLLKGQEPVPTKRNLEALAISYFNGDRFKNLKPATQADYRRYIEHIRKIWSSRDPQKLETRHIYALHQANKHHWRQANYLVQVLVVLLNHARLIGFLGKDQVNPAKGIPLFKQKGDGWPPWPQEMMAEFEEIASPRTRLVYELALGTGQRIGDVLRLRWDHFAEGAFNLTQGKTDKPLWVPMTDRLRKYLEGVEKRGLTVVCDKVGRPVRYKIIRDEMRSIKLGRVNTILPAADMLSFWNE